jgi:hypothetical protein
MIYLDVCCNDPDNGLFNHMAPALHVGDCEFEALNWHEGKQPRFVETPSGIRLAGKNWKVESSKDWYGNWCWNRYLLWRKGTTPRWYMLEFLTWLKGRKLYSLNCGPSTLFRWWQDELSLTPAELHYEINEMG